MDNLFKFVVASLLAGCAATVEPAKAPAQCTDLTTCQELEKEVSRVYQVCQQGQGPQRCKDELADRTAVRAQLNQARRQAQAAEREDVAAKHASDRAIRAEEDMTRSIKITGKCEDDAIVADAKKYISADNHAALQSRASAARASQIAAASSMLKPVRVVGLKDPNTALDKVTEVRAAVDAVRCDERAADLVAKADEWEIATRKAVEEENACRHSRECSGARIVPELCQAIKERQGYVGEIARERANPGGVTNLTYLHGLGQTIQMHDDRIAKLKKEYADTTRRPFQEAVCGRNK